MSDALPKLLSVMDAQRMTRVGLSVVEACGLSPDRRLPSVSAANRARGPPTTTWGASDACPVGSRGPWTAALEHRSRSLENSCSYEGAGSLDELKPIQLGLSQLVWTAERQIGASKHGSCNCSVTRAQYGKRACFSRKTVPKKPAQVARVLLGGLSCD